jgi:hypothetical protein
MSDSASDAGRPEPHVDYEVVDLVGTLRSYGVLTRNALFDRSGASAWVERSFDGALRRGVESGAIKSLGEDLFEVGDNAPEASRGKFDPP